jgi:hypothetical protein
MSYPTIIAECPAYFNYTPPPPAWVTCEMELAVYTFCRNACKQEWIRAVEVMQCRRAHLKQSATLIDASGPQMTITYAQIAPQPDACPIPSVFPHFKITANDSRNEGFVAELLNPIKDSDRLFRESIPPVMMCFDKLLQMDTR